MCLDSQKRTSQATNTSPINNNMLGTASGCKLPAATPVHKSGLLGTSGDGIWNLDDGIIPAYKSLAAGVHTCEGRILAQLAHSAGTVLINQPGASSWSASAIRSETSGNISHAMTLDEIEEVIAAYADAAHRAAEGELDGVEILGAFGFLPHAFLSPLTNFQDRPVRRKPR